MYKVIFRTKARKNLQKLPQKDQKRIAVVIDTLEQNPFAGKKMDADLDGYWSVRCWPYRIIYTIEKEIVTVTIVAIGNRKDIYERLRRAL